MKLKRLAAIHNRLSNPNESKPLKPPPARRPSPGRPARGATDQPRAGARLFVYGSLMEPEMRRRLLGREVGSEPGYLPGFERRRGRYFYVVPKPAAIVAGEILGPLSARELKALDRYEEVPKLYTRRRLTVLGRGRQPRRAWVYLPTARLVAEAAP